MESLYYNEEAVTERKAPVTNKAPAASKASVPSNGPREPISPKGLLMPETIETSTPSHEPAAAGGADAGSTAGAGRRYSGLAVANYFLRRGFEHGVATAPLTDTLFLRWPEHEDAELRRYVDGRLDR